jgi:hypothetical protein
MRAFHRFAAGAAALVLAFCFTAASHADECPDAKSAASGFIAQRDSAQTEVLQSSKTEVQQITRLGSQAVLDVTFYQGLLELDRLDRGRRTVLRPIHDLAKNYPPVAGKSTAAVFEIGEGPGKVLRTFVLDVKKAETLTVGGCQFKVLRIEQKVAQGEAKPSLREIIYYAPELKFIVAKAWPERDGTMTMIKYDRIYLKPR